MCFAQGHNIEMLVRLKTATTRSRDKYSTTGPLHSLLLDSILNEWYAIQQIIWYIILTHSAIENKEMIVVMDATSITTNDISLSEMYHDFVKAKEIWFLMKTFDIKKNGR